MFTRRVTCPIASLTIASVLAAVMVVATAPAAAEGKPAVIRIANPGVGIGGRPVVGSSPWSLLHIKGILEEEFKPDGIKVEWTFLRGAGPAVNELFANGLADIASLGDLPSIIGKSSGLKTRMLATSGLSNRYIAVPSDSSVQSVKDLAGRRFAMAKGTCNHLAANRILETFGLTEKDVRTINMDNPTMLAALNTKDIDAAIGGPELLQLRDRGAVRIIHTTKGDARYTCNSTIIVSDDFATKYPSIVKRIVRAHVKISKWFTDKESNPAEIYQMFSKSGVPFSNHKEEWTGDSFKVRASPLLDGYLVARYTSSVKDAQRYNLIRGNTTVNTWIDNSFLNEVLKEEGLENFWPQRPVQ
jgi:sulfonate transport system substrate-binding protein